MVIYGVALLSFCMLVGIFAGDLLGDLIGVQANVGGVGIAMLLLIIGIACWLNSVWFLVVVPVFVGLMNSGVIVREIRACIDAGCSDWSSCSTSLRISSRIESIS